MRNSSYKWLIVFIGLAILLLLIFLLGFSLSINPEELRFNENLVLIFFFASSLVVMILMEFLLRFYQGNSSYVFLLTVFLKIGFFVLIFSHSVFGLESFSTTEKVVIVLPMMLFLLIESMFLMKRIDT